MPLGDLGDLRDLGAGLPAVQHRQSLPLLRALRPRGRSHRQQNCFFLALPPPLRRCCVCTSREEKQGGRAGRCWRSTPKPAGLQARRARACIVFPPSYPSCRKHRFFFSFYLYIFFFHAFWLLDRLMLEQEHPLSCGSCLGCKTCCEWSKSDCGGGVLLCAKL